MSFRSMLILAALFVGGLPRSVVAQADPDADKPLDLVIAVDVSISMFLWQSNDKFNTWPVAEVRKAFPPSDPDGFRWDGVQLLLDLAGRNDRVALVLFRADTMIASSYLPEAVGGFVPVGTGDGRKKLKTMVEQLKAAETGPDAVLNGRSKYAVEAFGEPNDLPLRHGTSNLWAVRTIARDLLGNARPASQCRVVLFTDGRDAPPFAEPVQSKAVFAAEKGYFDYIERREKLGPTTKLDGFLNDVIGADRTRFTDPARPVPLYAFALGSDCDTPLMQALAASTGSANRADLSGAFYHAKTNKELLEQIQRVGWELRQRWRLNLPPTRGDTLSNTFRVPAVGAWDEVGALLLATVSTAGGSERAVRPKDVRVTGPVPAEPTRWCDSHAFVAFDRPAAGMVGDADLIADRPGGASPVECTLGLRTTRPLFTLEQPTPFARPPQTPYTPLDAIPFRVRFTPPDDRFLASDFELRATLTPLFTPATGPTPPPVTVALLPRVIDGQTYFAADLLLDRSRNASDPPRKDFAGRWAVDVSIRGTGGPLQRAERNLIRRELTVGDYPGLVADGAADTMLANTPVERSVVRVPVKLDLTFPPTAPLPAVGLLVDVSAGAGWPEGVDIPTATVGGWENGKATVEVRVPASVWGKLPLGKPVGGNTVSVRLPWADATTAVTSQFRVEKKPFKLRAVEEKDGVRVDLSPDPAKPMGGAPVIGRVRVWLDTVVEAAEPVTLSLSSDGVDTGGELELKPRAGTAKNQQVRVSNGLGSAITAVGGATPAPVELTFALDRSQKLPAGRYEGKLFIRGTSVESIAVPVFVDADLPKVQLLQDGVGEPRDIAQLELRALKGSDVSCRVRLVSQLRGEPVASGLPALPVPEAIETPVAGQPPSRLPLKRAGETPIGEQDSHDLRFQVDPAVADGRYRSTLTFRYQNLPDKTPLELALPVYVQVVRHGLIAEAGTGMELVPEKTTTRFRLPYQAGKGSKAVGKLTLKTELSASNSTDAQPFEVRWHVTAEPIGTQPAAKAPTDWRKLFRVKDAKGQDVLTDNPAQPRGTTPVTANAPQTVEIEADAAALPPGLYRWKLQFHARLDTAQKGGDPYECEVELLVPGRVLSAKWASEPAEGRIGQPAKIVAEITGYGSAAGTGSVVPLGEVAGSTAVEFAPSAPPQPDARYPKMTDRVLYTFTAEVTPNAIGVNRYEVRWSAEANGFPALTATLPDFRARGKPVAEPRVVAPKETVEVRLAVAPGSVKPGQSVALEAVPVTDPTKPIAVPLTDDGSTESSDKQRGDSIYSGKVTLPEPGRYTLRWPAQSNALKELEELEIVAGLEVEARHRRGKIIYGGGALNALVGSETWDGDALRIVNKRDTKCFYTVRVWYPGTNELAARLKADPTLAERLPPKELRAFNPELDLQYLPKTAGKTEAFGEEPMSQLTGELLPQETLEAGVLAGLSKSADEAITSGQEHPSVKGDMLAVVEVQLYWPDDGTTIVRRDVVIVKPEYWTAPALIRGGLMLAGGIVVVFLAVQWWKRRMAKKRGTQPPFTSPPPMEGMPDGAFDVFGQPSALPPGYPTDHTPPRSDNGTSPPPPPPSSDWKPPTIFD